MLVALAAKVMSVLPLSGILFLTAPMSIELLALKNKEES